MFLNHFKNFYPGVGRDRVIEVAAHFRIVANLGSGLMLDAGDGGKSELYKQMKKDPDNGEWVLFVDV